MYMRNNASVYDLLQNLEVSCINTRLMRCNFAAGGSFFNKWWETNPCIFLNYHQGGTISPNAPPLATAPSCRTKCLWQTQTLLKEKTATVWNETTRPVLRTVGSCCVLSGVSWETRLFFVVCQKVHQSRSYERSKQFCELYFWTQLEILKLLIFVYLDFMMFSD